MGDLGAPGAQAVMQGLEQAVAWAMEYFGIQKEDILIGYRQEPPKIEGYELYVYYNGGVAEYWKRKGNRWVNWCYQW